MKLENLEKNIGYTFKNKELIKTALTHTSYAYEMGTKSYEKLEFLGDSILEFVTSEYIFENYSHLKEGEMTKVRAMVVCEDSLSKIAKLHNFSDFLYLGKSELLSGGRERTAILEDTFEAMIAAIYLDGGINPAKEFIINSLKDEIEYASKNVGLKDYKTVLQEKLQEKGEVKIEYIILKEIGPDHDKTFVAEVKCDGVFLATGEGKSKKVAEMQAAKCALENLKNKN